VGHAGASRKANAMSAGAKTAAIATASLCAVRAMRAHVARAQKAGCWHDLFLAFAGETTVLCETR
jgi:hypothetical protein